MKLIVTVSTNGVVRSIYDDRLLPLLRGEGDAEIARASHVEPNRTGTCMASRWYIDLSPAGLGRLGKRFCDSSGRPFETRADALTEERLLLEKHWLKGPNAGTFA